MEKCLAVSPTRAFKVRNYSTNDIFLFIVPTPSTRELINKFNNGIKLSKQQQDTLGVKAPLIL